jgi:chromosome segregation protein
MMVMETVLKKVMDLKADKPGIAGVVADLIKVEKNIRNRCRNCVRWQYTEYCKRIRRKTAKEAIEYLKQNKFG